MNLFVTKQAFNEKLLGKAVHIKGHDVDGDSWDRSFLVKEVGVEFLTLTNCQGKELCVHAENFVEKNLLTLTVLEAK